MSYLIRIIALAIFFILLQSCVAKNSAKIQTKKKEYKKISNVVVKNQNNICSIFKQQPNWYFGALKSSKEWNIPIHVMMTFIKQESSFKAKARPPYKKKKNKFGKPISVSSAYGFAQAKTNTWKDFTKKTNKSKYRRDVFSDSAYFIGWYNSQSIKLLALKSYDTYNLYLAYHEGWTGFKRGSYNKKPWLKKVAKKVRDIGYRYSKQLKNCNLKKLISNKQNELLIVKPAHVKPIKAINGNRSGFNCRKILGWPICTPFQN